MDDHLQHRRLPFLGQTAHLCRLNGLPRQHPHPGEPFLGPLQSAGYRHLIDFVHLMPGVQQLLGQGPVIGEQQQPLGILIQPSHGEHSPAAVRHQFRRRFAAPLVGEGGDVPSGLVQHQIHRLRCRSHRPSVHQQGIPLRVAALPQSGHPAVEGHTPLPQQFLCRPAGGDTAAGDPFLQTFLHGIPPYGPKPNSYRAA